MKAWENFLAVLEVELGIDTVAKWLRPLKILKFDACNLYLEAKDSFHGVWFDEHVKPKLQNRFTNNNGRKIKVHLSIVGGEKGASASSTTRKGRKEKNEVIDKPAFALSFDELDPHCTFNHLSLLKGNELAFKLLCEITGFQPEKRICDPSKRLFCSFNPVYFYGGVGSGKTHMLMATTYALRSQGLRVIYSRAETFTHHVVSAIRSGDMPVFRNAYRNIDVLIIDDVHVFARKGATQEELFHTFNTLHMSGRQIILSANCSPQELQLIEPRLVSRFEWGIVVPIESQSSEELDKILQTKADALQFELSSKVKEFLKEEFANNKTLMRALEALVLRSHLHSVEGRLHLKGALTVAQARNLLVDLIEEEKKAAITSDKIIQGVADHYGITIDDILSKAQSRDCAVPRQVAMYLCRTKLKSPFMKIGDLFGRDHSTVMTSVKQIQKGLDNNDPELVASVNYIAKRLTAVNS